MSTFIKTDDICINLAHVAWFEGTTRNGWYYIRFYGPELTSAKVPVMTFENEVTGKGVYARLMDAIAEPARPGSGTGNRLIDPEYAG